MTVQCKLVVGSSLLCCSCKAPANASAGFASAQRLVRDPTGVAAELVPGITMPTFAFMVAVWALRFGAVERRREALVHRSPKGRISVFDALATRQPSCTGRILGVRRPAFD
jgi:hypothetical protein